MKKKDLGLLALAIAAGALVVGFSLWWHYKEDPEELIRIKNVAVGYLENAKEDEYQLAAPLFEKLVQALPEDPLGYRNLTIALFAPNDLTNRWMTKSVFGAGGPARLLASVEGMLRVEGRESAAAYYLAGRVFREYADEVRWEGPALDEALAKARRYFREAARLSPRDPAPYYQLSYLESEFVAPDRPSNEAFEALQAAVRLAPDNLWLRADWLSLLAGREDPELRDAVAQTQRILPPDCNPGVPKYLGEAAALLAQNDPTARRQSAPSATSAANLLRSHPKAKQDQKQVNPFTSAFVLTDFGSSFSSRLPPEIVEPPIPVKFVAVPHGDAAPATSIVALSRVELTSQPIEELGSCVSRNHEFGTVVLRPGKERSQVQVLAAQGKGAFPPIEVAGTFTNFALVDLDWDLFYAKLRPTDKDAAKVPADLDLVLYGPSGVRIFENREENRARHWVDRTDDAKIPKLSGVQWLLAQDIDHDGNIDLVVGLEKGVRVLRNLGEMEFAEITGRSAGLSELQTIAAAAADFDRDGDLDIMCLTKTGTLVLLENERGGRFAAKEQPGDFAKATTLIAFDANNDGRVDLLIGHGSGATLLLAHETQTLPIAAKRMELATNSAVRQMGFFDYDNDGWMDLWLLTDDANKPLRLFRNVNGTRFEDTTNLLPELFGPITAVCVSDFDDDGDLDLLLAGANGVIGLRNDGGNQNNWLDLRVRAIENKGESGTGQAAKVNYFNTGGTIEIRSGRHYQWQQVADTVTHFGLGKRRQLDAARIIWTNGVPQAVIRPHINQAVAAEQAPKGSCPFLFAWNGERFVMVTDCLWSSALGMKLAPDVYMDHHRQENHLIITDDQLRPRNG